MESFIDPRSRELLNNSLKKSRDGFLNDLKTDKELKEKLAQLNEVNEINEVNEARERSSQGRQERASVLSKTLMEMAGSEEFTIDEKKRKWLEEHTRTE